MFYLLTNFLKNFISDILFFNKFIFILFVFLNFMFIHIFL